MQLEPIASDVNLRIRSPLATSQERPVEETSAIRPLEAVEQERDSLKDQIEQFSIEVEEELAEDIAYSEEVQRQREENEALLFNSLERIEIERSMELAEAFNQAEQVVVIGSLVVDTTA